MFVEECQDPVSIVVHYELYGDVGSTYVEFQYVFNQSEVVDNDGIYSYGETERYTVTMARNASHVGFEVYIYKMIECQQKQHNVQAYSILFLSQ